MEATSLSLSLSLALRATAQLLPLLRASNVECNWYHLHNIAVRQVGAIPQSCYVHPAPDEVETL
jgi:hypothetical protein